MKKTTPKSLTKRLAQYGALTAAITGVADANGQIVYTDIDPDDGGVGVQYLLDMDNDGNSEFVINQTGNNLFAAPIPSSAAILGIDSTYDYPFALDNGDNISAGLTDWLSGNGYYKTMNYNSCNYSSSQWCAVTDKYLGLRFNIGANTHYGWARLDAGLSPGTDGYTIKDYAYNSVAGEPISAGQTLSVDKFSSQVFCDISCKDKIVTISKLTGNANYRILSLTGKQLINGETHVESKEINASNLASGIYIVEVRSADSNAVERKKIVIQ
ncbi:hypothetical protein C1T31_06165 [Hanstruepera neustonica]|uniref:Secretion system C-terminal sorting domain-containing protein n=1 Tax=Hanstruepera neustonica TaxID=1445657 RepID=A0A2K1E0V3_9FLAO|nr:T9SS type A sorting domain-containing protein [Hanstruepera neustonica]PNQ73906.1 hypothetical protein C1T31_06165 [Hanstruepera neustonica]